MLATTPHKHEELFMCFYLVEWLTLQFINPNQFLVDMKIFGPMAIKGIQTMIGIMANGFGGGKGNGQAGENGGFGFGGQGNGAANGKLLLIYL